MPLLLYRRPAPSRLPKENCRQGRRRNHGPKPTRAPGARRRHCSRAPQAFCSIGLRGPRRARRLRVRSGTRSPGRRRKAPSPARARHAPTRQCSARAAPRRKSGPLESACLLLSCEASGAVSDYVSIATVLLLLCLFRNLAVIAPLLNSIELLPKSCLARAAPDARTGAARYAARRMSLHTEDMSCVTSICRPFIARP